MVASPAFAQDRGGQVTSRDVLRTAPSPAPENGGDIIVKFGETIRVYFKRPLKTVRLDDDLTVSAVPQSGHVVEFKGIAPGRTQLTIESAEGRSDTFGMVTVVREPHEVRIYQHEQINRQTGERRSDSSSNIGGYVSLQCNEIKCDEQEPALQSKLPR